MARKLNSLDLQILKKIAPELADNTCGHAGWEFRSVLPPVSQHIMELFGKTRVVIKDGKVVEVGEPVADWCPVFSKVSNVSRLTSLEAKENMEYRIRELGYRNIAVTVVSLAEAGKLRLIEK